MRLPRSRRLEQDGRRHYLPKHLLLCPSLSRPLVLRLVAAGETGAHWSLVLGRGSLSSLSPPNVLDIGKPIKHAEGVAIFCDVLLLRNCG